MAINTTKSDQNLASGKLLARNTGWNLLGSVIPALVAIVCIPPIIRRLGTDRFGVLALAWTLVGYAGLFDLGLGRALTKLIAENSAEGNQEATYGLIWTSLSMMLGLGLLCMAITILLASWLTYHGLNIPAQLQSETLNSFYALGVCMPVVITTSGLRGVLEARQRFDLINWLRIPLGAFLLAGPLAVLFFSQSLFSVILVLVGARFISWLVHLLLCFRVMPGLRQHIHFQRQAVKPLLSYGGWMTITNIVGPLMVTFDRFIIGAVASVAAVAYYTTPFEVITKLWVVPSALVAVMFPAFSLTFVRDPDRTTLLFWRALKFIFVILFPVIVLAVVFASYGLTLWLGADFARHSARILRWLAIGVFINSLAQVPCVLVQGTGRPDLAAKLHFIELPAYLFVLWWMIHAHGVEGAAIAWTLRIAVDAIVMFLFALQILPRARSLLRRALIPLALAFLILGLAAIPEGLASKSIFSLSTLLIYGPVIWYVALSSDERSLLARSLKLSPLASSQ